MSSDAPFARFVAEHREVLEACSAMEPEVTAASRLLVECLQSGGQVILCGNGGSSSDAQHFAGELVGRFLTERRPLP
ncbi:MAG: SIS domain-containing protein, partial [Fimbriimonadaceae bacterium]|nr:SIS domain-containing protein [Fimbriimonadaceae bacterium]